MELLVCPGVCSCHRLDEGRKTKDEWGFSFALGFVAATNLLSSFVVRHWSVYVIRMHRQQPLRQFVSDQFRGGLERLD